MKTKSTLEIISKMYICQVYQKGIEEIVNDSHIANLKNKNLFDIIKKLITSYFSLNA